MINHTDSMPTESSQSAADMIIADDVTFSPILDFEAYSNTIVKMITQSHPKFSIGIYGEWGTGKTTLMKVIENKLNSIVKQDEFVWGDLRKNKNESNNRFKAFLKDKYKVDWIDNSQFATENDRTLSLYDTNKISRVDNKGTYDVKNAHSLTLQLNPKKDKASLTIDEIFIRDFEIKKENNTLKLYLQRNEILTVWFNAWRYEREDQFAIVALVKTIGFAMSRHPIYKELKPILLNAVKIIGKGFLSEIAAKYIGEKGVEEFKTQLLPKMEFLSELDKDTIYFDAINRIENEMRKILDENPSTRVVVFIDDLDRCSPKKALEVFESIKVFLGLDGFVYVVGLSHVTIAKLITAEYAKSEIKGEDYIKKIIQIPIILPEWNTKEVESLVDDFIEKNLVNAKYKNIIKKNSKLISRVVQNNPRDVKRFINNYIVAFEIHSSNKEINPSQLLLLQALNVQWSAFYQILVTGTQEFRDEIFKYADMDIDNRTAQLESDKTEDGFSKQAKTILREFKSEQKLWELLQQHKDILSKIENWEDYRRAAESVKEIPAVAPATFDYNAEQALNELMISLDRLSFMIGDITDVPAEEPEEEEDRVVIEKLYKLKDILGRFSDELKREDKINYLRMHLREIMIRIEKLRYQKVKGKRLSIKTQAIYDESRRALDLGLRLREIAAVDKEARSILNL